MAKKRLKDLKQSKDIYWRKRAKLQSLAPSVDLSADMRQVVNTAKKTPAEIRAQKLVVKNLERENRRIREKANEIKKRYAFEDEAGKARIDAELQKPEYKTVSLVKAKNKLRAVEGKDFDFYIDDGFEVFRINTKMLKKYWKQGKDPTIVILTKMKAQTATAIEYYNKKIEKEKKTASKAELKKMKRIRDGLKKKLKHTIEKNIQAIETGNQTYLNEVSEDEEKAYSILFKVIPGQLSVDRIGI